MARSVVVASIVNIFKEFSAQLAIFSVNLKRKRLCRNSNIRKYQFHEERNKDSENIYRQEAKKSDSVGQFKNFEHQSADGDTELASMNSGIPTIKIKRQNSDDLNNFSSSMKCSKDHVRLLLLALMMVGTLVAASRYAADHDQPQERQDSVVTLLFILCNSTMFVTSLAGVIYLLHEFPFKPWPQITVSMLFGPYMLLVFEISTNEALHLRALSIPILLALPLLAFSIPILLLAAVGKLSDFVWERSFSGSGDICPA